MSKELEALARQKSNVLELRETKFVEYVDDFALIEQALKRNEPKKVAMGRINYIGRPLFEPTCPLCGQWLTFSEKENYCPNCGHRLDWK